MTYKELEALALALPPAEAVQLLRVIISNLDERPDAESAYNIIGHEVRESAIFYSIEGGRHAMEAQVRLLIERLTHLPPARQAEVRDFIEFLHQQELAQSTVRDFSLASEKAFARIWDNDDDALYDKL